MKEKTKKQGKQVEAEKLHTGELYSLFMHLFFYYLKVYDHMCYYLYFYLHKNFWLQNLVETLKIVYLLLDFKLAISITPRAEPIFNTMYAFLYT